MITLRKYGRTIVDKKIISPGDKYIVFETSVGGEVSTAIKVKEWKVEEGNVDPHRCLKGGIRCYLCPFEFKTDGDNYGKDETEPHRNLLKDEQCPTCHWKQPNGRPRHRPLRRWFACCTVCCTVS